MNYDPMSDAAKQDPEGIFAGLRETCPVHHFVLSGETVDRISANPLVARPTNEFWSVLRYDDCVRVLQDPQTFSSKEGPGPERMLPLTEEGVLLFADDPAHIRQRRIMAKAFTPRAVDRVRPRIQQIADDLIDQLYERGEMELMEDFAIPLTIRTIAGIIGVAEDRISDFWRWGNAIVAAFGGDGEAAMAGLGALQELFGFLQALIDEIRADDAGSVLGDGVLASLVHAEYEGATLSDEEIRLACMQLITAGFETTSTATVSGVYLLCSHPGERIKLEQRPELIETAVEEVVRFAAPLEGLFRTATRDVEIAGCPIPANAKIRVVYASANHDDTQFTEPGTFRIDRDPEELRRHIAFGIGSHYCIGAALARAELACALSTLLRRLPRLRIDETRPAVRATALTINGVRSLGVAWDPSPTRQPTTANVTVSA